MGASKRGESKLIFWTDENNYDDKKINKYKNHLI